MRRDLAIGLSLSTLWFIGVWSDLLPFLYLSGRLPIGGLPCWNDFAAVVANVTLLGLGFACAGQLARRGPPWVRTLAGWALLGSLAVPVNALRMHFRLPPEYWYYDLGPIGGPLALVLIGLLLLFVAARWPSRTRRVAGGYGCRSSGLRHCPGGRCEIRIARYRPARRWPSCSVRKARGPRDGRSPSIPRQ